MPLLSRQIPVDDVTALTSAYYQELQDAIEDYVMLHLPLEGGDMTGIISWYSTQTFPASSVLGLAPSYEHGGDYGGDGTATVEDHVLDDDIHFKQDTLVHLSPSAAEAGDIEITGSVTADTFVGDGSALSGIATAEYAVSAGGAVVADSLTNNPNVIYYEVVSVDTNTISVTGIGTETLSVSGGGVFITLSLENLTLGSVNYKIYFNGDTTDSDYDSRYIRVDGTGITSGSYNAPHILELDSGEVGMVDISIQLMPNGTILYSTVGVLGDGPNKFDFVGRIDGLYDSVTELAIAADQEDGIGEGSTIGVYRRKW